MIRTHRQRIALLISGTGTVAQSVMDAARQGILDAEIVALISHEPWSYGLLRAEREGVPALLHDLAEYRLLGKSDSSYSEELATKLLAFRPDLVVLTDWRLPLGDALLSRFHGRLLRSVVALPGQAYTVDPYGRSSISILYEALRAGGLHEASVRVEQPSTMGASLLVAEERLPLYPSDTLADIEERATRYQQALLISTLTRSQGEPL